MTTRSVVSLRPVGTPARRRRFYRALARALVATPSPCGALFESTTRDPGPRVTLRPLALVATVDALPGSRDLLLERVPVGEAPTPPGSHIDRIRPLVPLALPGTRPHETTEAPDRLASLLGPTGWVGVQTHWIRWPGGQLRIARRVRIAMHDRDDLDRRIEAIAAALALDFASASGVPMTTWPARRGARRDWRRGSVRTIPSEAWLAGDVERAESTAEPGFLRSLGLPLAPEGHSVVFGSSGAGKTTYLAHRAAEHASRSGSLVVVDLHGDLAPAVLERMDPVARRRVVAVDASDPPVVGIAALRPSADGADRAAAHLVAGLKRLSPDGSELHWGFRLERIFDTFVRIVLDSGGSLLDLYDLLTDPDRRDAARLTTRRPDVARFLDELAPVVRRQPDFLWSAATRLSKVVLVPALAELLAPADGGLEVEKLVRSGRPLLVRLPFASLGPEAAAFAGTLVLARLYLGLAARAHDGRPSSPTLVVLDEVQGFAPRLVAEILSESRKFGLRILVATQYPERLAVEARGAVAGAPEEVVAFRIPHALARTVGVWIGLGPDEAERLLPGLATGQGFRLAAGDGGPRPVDVDRPLPRGVEPRGGWSEAVRATRAEFPPDDVQRLDDPAFDRATEELLLAVLAAEENGSPLAERSVVDAARALPGASTEPFALAERWRRLVARGCVTSGPDGLRLSDLGARRLGLGRTSGASRESDEHRRLLVTAFRLFARRGYRLEILRQGRFDTTLPDARFEQLPHHVDRTPAELARELERRRGGWAWRFFGGRDVHVEAEVSGALRAERIRHGWRKADGRGAFALFLVGDAARARRVRGTLRSLGVGVDRAQVWTLPPTLGASAAPGQPARRERT